MKIYKYLLTGIYPGKPMLLDIRSFTKPISIGTQNGELVMWAEICTEADFPRHIEILALFTGQEFNMPNTYKFINTVQDPRTELVWHFYWRAI